MYHKRLLNNVNSWGKVEFNVPLRVSDNETRTSYNVGHRYIPPVQKYFVCVSTDTLQHKFVGNFHLTDLNGYIIIYCS